MIIFLVMIIGLQGIAISHLLFENNKLQKRQIELQSTIANQLEDLRKSVKFIGEMQK